MKTLDEAVEQKKEKNGYDQQNRAMEKQFMEEALHQRAMKDQMSLARQKDQA